MFRCFFCYHEVIWDNDFMLSEVSDIDDDEAIVSYYLCPFCGRSYEVSEPLKEEKADEYSDYWNEEPRRGEYKLNNFTTMKKFSEWNWKVRYLTYLLVAAAIVFGLAALSTLT